MALKMDMSYLPLSPPMLLIWHVRATVECENSNDLVFERWWMTFRYEKIMSLTSVGNLSQWEGRALGISELH